MRGCRSYGTETTVPVPFSRPSRSPGLAIVPVRTAGVVNRPECTVQATLAKVKCVILHGQDHVGPLSIHALLAESDRVPLLLGVSGILEQVRLLLHIPANSAFLEAPLMSCRDQRAASELCFLFRSDLTQSRIVQLGMREPET